MTRILRLIVSCIVTAAATLAGCSARVRYSDPSRKIGFELKPADRAVDLIE